MEFVYRVAWIFYEFGKFVRILYEKKKSLEWQLKSDFLNQ